MLAQRARTLDPEAIPSHPGTTDPNIKILSWKGLVLPLPA
jgi:hypothetical protein